MLLYLGIIASVVAAANSFTEPEGSQQVHSASNLYIAWSNLKGDKVDLSLMNGDPANLQLVEVIGVDIPNQGSTEWYVPESVPEGEYTLRIASDEEDSENYSHFFSINPIQAKNSNLEASSFESSTANAAIKETSIVLPSNIKKRPKKKQQRQCKHSYSNH